MATHPSILALPEKFHGQRNLVRYSPWGNRELDTTEHLSTQHKMPWPHWRLLVWTGPGHTGRYQGSIHTDQQDDAVCVLHPCQLDSILFSLNFTLWSDQIRSVAQSCPTLCEPMNGSTPGLPVHHQLPEFTETHVHRVSDAIQPSHTLWWVTVLIYKCTLLMMFATFYPLFTNHFCFPFGEFLIHVTCILISISHLVIRRFFID